jgi:hypothetical protein
LLRQRGFGRDPLLRHRSIGVFEDPVRIRDVPAMIGIDDVASRSYGIFGHQRRGFRNPAENAFPLNLGKYSPMNVHTLRLFVALLFLIAASPALAQTNDGVRNKIVLFGHSAGASHVAAYAFERRFQPASGSGLAGVILGSGLYDPALGPITPRDPPNAAAAAHYGAATLIFEVELDPLPMLISNGNLYSSLCHRDNQCPLMYRFLMHDYLSGPSAIDTGEETVSTPLLDFIRAR